MPRQIIGDPFGLPTVWNRFATKLGGERASVARVCEVELDHDDVVCQLVIFKILGLAPAVVEPPPHLHHLVRKLDGTH